MRGPAFANCPSSGFRIASRRLKCPREAQLEQLSFVQFRGAVAAGDVPGRKEGAPALCPLDLSLAYQCHARIVERNLDFPDRATKDDAVTTSENLLGVRLGNSELDLLAHLISKYASPGRDILGLGQRSGMSLEGGASYDVVIGRDAIAIKSATTSSSGRLASSSCVQLSLRSGSTLARSSRIIARSTGVFP